MVRGLSILVVLVELSVGTAFAQEVDARAALLASLKAMGGENLKTIEIAAAGSSSLIGQQFSVEGNWPQFEVANYTRAIDFDAKWSREDYTRRQGNFPAFGRVPMAEQRVTAIVSGSYAWDMNNGMPVPITRPYLDGVPVNELRQLELAITPHGFLKAALAASDAKAIKMQYIGASDFGLSQFGRWVTIVSVHLPRQVQDQRHDRRPQSRGARRHLVPESRLRRHGLRDALHAVQGLRRREVPDAAAHPPGRSAGERRAQLLRVPGHQREAERAGDDDAGARRGAHGRDAAGEGRESAARRRRVDARRRDAQQPARGVQGLRRRRRRARTTRRARSR